jgi:hypothetical protein
MSLDDVTTYRTNLASRLEISAIRNLFIHTHEDLDWHANSRNGTLT